MDENLFEARTPLGFNVRLPRERWQIIITMKHPAMAGRDQDVFATLVSPEQIRRSRADDSVFLFYRTDQPGRWICSVVKRVHNDDAFVITAYPTDAIKEGQTIWTR